jgi:uncharacterized membrane protein YGL010W
LFEKAFLMRNLTEQIANYAAYHRDRRNIATHFIGVPMIVVAVTTLLAQPTFPVGGASIAAVWPVALAAALYYLALDLRFGLAMAALLALAVWAGTSIAALSTAAWLGGGLGLFVVGWIFQFIGHAYEGRKPAFLDDIMGLLIGPLFLVTEAAFALGLAPALRQAVQQRAGPTHGGRAPAQSA